MLSLNENVKYVVWGTGIHAAQFSYAKRNLINIEFYIDNAVEENEWTFFGKKVLKYDEAERFGLKDYFIILATAENVYSEIKKQLHEIGYKEFKSFAYYQFFLKKIVLLHGNCHMRIVKQFLLSSEDFSRQYAIYPLTAIQNIKEKYIDKEVLENCDLFIHEDIQAENEYGFKLSDEYILPRLKRECVKITIPNLFGMGRAFFPQMIWNEHNPGIRGNLERNGFFPHGDVIIDRAVEMGKEIGEILALMEEKPFSEEEILDNFRLYMSKIEQREKNWDIPIYNFISMKYKKEKLFFDSGHPTNIVMKEIAIGILRKLDIVGENIFCKEEMNSHEEFVYDIVRETLELEWKDTEIRKGINGKKMGTKMTREEYVREYLFWCYGIEGKELPK